MEGGKDDERSRLDAGGTVGIQSMTSNRDRRIVYIGTYCYVQEYSTFVQF